MFDSHFHLTDPRLITHKDVVNGELTGVEIGADFESLPAIFEFAAKNEHVFCTAGVHPAYADTYSANDLENFVAEHLNFPKFVAIGECGLDYHYNPETKKIQCLAFERQIEIAHRLKKPLIIHAREADDDIITILNSANCAGLLTHGGVLHCFTGSQRLADKALEVGFYISASGVITFKNAEAIRDVFQTVPIERLLIETDSPYMAPVPYRGKVNEPAFMIKTAEKLAEIKGLTLAEIDRITTQNFYTLFKKEVPHES